MRSIAEPSRRSSSAWQAQGIANYPTSLAIGLYIVFFAMYLSPKIAGLIDAVVSNARLRDEMLTRQDAALERLLAKDFAGLLGRFVEQALHAPRRSRPPVAFDFWDQVRQAEWLEEIREYRPAAFQALPKDQGPGGPRP